MSEATLTATAPAGTLALQAGAIVQFRPDGADRPHLAIVAEIADRSDTVQVISWRCPGDEDLVTYATSRGSLMAAPQELDVGQWALARRLTAQLATQLRDRRDQLQAACAQTREQADAARAKIESMRAYAIGKHLDGDICRDGLNEFLAAHDLDPYQPCYSARVTVSFDVEVHDAASSREATSRIRNCVEISSDDEGDVSITSETDLDIRDVQQVRDE